MRRLREAAAGGGSSSSAGGVLFAELRVITLITKKYSILKTTTTGKTPLAGCCVALLSKSAGAAGAVSAVRRSLCVVCVYKL